MNAHLTHSASYMGRTRRLHFIGIGGAGMSGIAELMANPATKSRARTGARAW